MLNDRFAGFNLGAWAFAFHSGGSRECSWSKSSYQKREISVAQQAWVFATDPWQAWFAEALTIWWEVSDILHWARSKPMAGLCQRAKNTRYTPAPICLPLRCIPSRKKSLGRGNFLCPRSSPSLALRKCARHRNRQADMARPCNKNIFRLHVSIDKALVMNKFKRHSKLCDNKCRDCLAQWATVHNLAVKITTASVLHDNVNMPYWRMFRQGR